jgi:DNA-3-methyladenine glycosylase I
MPAKRASVAKAPKKISSPPRSAIEVDPNRGRVEATGAVICDDGLARTPWAASDALLREYYDTEWGMPVRDERGLFERLALEGFQSGLSWITILRKRDAFRAAFRNFVPETIAKFDDKDVARLLADPAIIRNRAKILATIKNAAATIALRAEGGLVDFIWSFQPKETPMPTTVAEVPTVSDASIALSEALKKKGFSFVGPVTMHALMEATGMIDTHLVGSYRRGCSGVWPRE